MYRNNNAWRTLKRTLIWIGLILTPISLILGIILSCNSLTHLGNVNGNGTATSSTQTGKGVTPVQATATPTPSPTPTPKPTPTPTLVVIHNKQLSQDMLLDNSCTIIFYVPPQDVVVNKRLMQADFSMYAFSSCAFKLDTRQKSLQIECGLPVNGNNGYQGDKYELKVLGDNQELLSQVYTVGAAAIAKEVGIQGVQILTFELTGPYYNPTFYCKDQLIY